MEVPGPDSDWRSPQFRQKVVAQIEEAMRKAGTAHTKSSNDMENHVYVKAKSREEYLSLVARLIIHFRDIHKKTLGGPDPMNALTNLTGVGGGPGAIGMGPRPAGAPVGGMGAMGQMQIGQHAMAGVTGNPQAIGGPGQMPMQQMVQQQQQQQQQQQSIQFQQFQQAQQQQNAMQQQQNAAIQQQQQQFQVQQQLRVQQQLQQQQQQHHQNQQQQQVQNQQQQNQMHQTRIQQQQQQMVQLQLQQHAQAQSLQHMVQQQQQQQQQAQAPPQPNQMPPHTQQQQPGMVPQSLAGQMTTAQHVPINSLSQQQQQQHQLKIQAFQARAALQQQQQQQQQQVQQAQLNAAAAVGGAVPGQTNKQMPAKSSSSHMKQPSPPALSENVTKYDPDSQDAKRLNRAVAEFICLDQVPVYTTEKTGFRNLVQQLDKKYNMPGSNFFMCNEIPKLYSETREIIQAQIMSQPFFACTTDIWTSRAVDAYMAVTIQYITESWELQSWCLGCSALYSDHTSDSLHETLEEIVSEKWRLPLSKMSGITTDNAPNNKKAFESYTWIPCFGHNLNLAVGKALAVDRVSACLSRLRTTVSAFSRSSEMIRSLKEKQMTLNLPEQNLTHDEPTSWNSTFEMVDRFCTQQHAVRAVLAEKQRKWHLMLGDSDMATLETVREVLGPLSSFTDALSGEKDPTLSSVLPLKWKIFSCLEVKDGESNFSCDMKNKIRNDFAARYESRLLETVLNTATFLDPRFKDSFVTMEEEVKAILMQKTDGAFQLSENPVQAAEQPHQEDQGGPKKKKKTDLKGLLSTIKHEKREESGETSGVEERTGCPKTPADQLRGEFILYKQMKEISASEDPLTWWKNHAATLPTLAHFARQYLAIPASSCASERVFSTSGCNLRRTRLSEENIDTLVFLEKNLKVAKELSRH